MYLYLMKNNNNYLKENDLMWNRLIVKKLGIARSSALKMSIENGFIRKKDTIYKYSDLAYIFLFNKTEIENWNGIS